MAHYHIVWILGPDSRVDFASFTTTEEAKRCAEYLLRVGERYRIVEYAGECSRDCPAWKSRYRPPVSQN